MQKTVFYSWQSDLPNRTNRTFIQDALQKAIDAVIETELEIDLVLDRDTKGTAGAPDIGKTILDKIDRAAVAVTDVSIVNRTGDGRPTPNPNVLFELGYAVPVLSWDYVLPVLNLGTGPIEDLPFDLRSRRPVTYVMREDVVDKAPELKSWHGPYRKLCGFLSPSTKRERQTCSLCSSGPHRVSVCPTTDRFQSKSLSSPSNIQKR